VREEVDIYRPPKAIAFRRVKVGGFRRFGKAVWSTAESLLSYLRASGSLFLALAKSIYFW